MGFVIDSNSFDIGNEIWNEHIKTDVLIGNFILLEQTHLVTFYTIWSKLVKCFFSSKNVIVFSKNCTIKCYNNSVSIYTSNYCK